MADVSHTFGQDVDLGPNNDLLVIDGSALTKQFLIRRLMTPHGGYLWRLDYGGGLPQFVGATVNAVHIENVVQAQALLEPMVAQVPIPVVTTTPGISGATVDIQYADAQSGAIVKTSVVLTDAAAAS